MNADGSDDVLTDIGHGVRISVRRYVADPDRPIGGVYYEHPRPDGSGTCHGWAAIPDKDGWPEHSWTLVSEDPLTLIPSLLCRACGHHGHITDGHWVPA